MQNLIRQILLYGALLHILACSAKEADEGWNSSLSTVRIALPDNLSGSAAEMNGYQLVIKPTGATCKAGAKSVDKVVAWKDDQIAESLSQGCDYTITLSLGILDTTKTKLAKVYYSNSSNVYRISAADISHKSSYAIELKLSLTDEGRLAGISGQNQGTRDSAYRNPGNGYNNYNNNNYPYNNNNNYNNNYPYNNNNYNNNSYPPQNYNGPRPSNGSCVFSFSPLPKIKDDGSRGSTYGGHGSCRDYGISEGTSLYAMGQCSRRWVDSSGDGKCGYGMGFVCELAGQMMRIVYCHMSEPPIDKSDYQIGEFVGYSGNTGNSTGPHLHFGLRYDDGDQPVEDDNPDNWLANNNCYNDPVGGESLSLTGRLTSVKSAGTTPKPTSEEDRKLMEEWLKDIKEWR